MADTQNPGGNGNTPVNRLKRMDEAVTFAQTGRTASAFEAPLDRLVRLDKQDPERARILGAKIRDAIPSLSTKPLSAQDKLRLRR